MIQIIYNNEVCRSPDVVARSEATRQSHSVQRCEQ